MPAASYYFDGEHLQPSQQARARPLVVAVAVGRDRRPRTTLWLVFSVPGFIDPAQPVYRLYLTSAWLYDALSSASIASK